MHDNISESQFADHDQQPFEQFEDDFDDAGDENRRTSRFASWMTSAVIHVVALAVLALVAIAYQESPEKIPVRAATLPTPTVPDIPEERELIQTVDVEVEVSASPMAQALEPLELPIEIDSSLSDAAAVATTEAQVATAIGAGGGGGGNGGFGAFAAGGDGIGGGGFFGVGDGDGTGIQARRVVYIIDMSRSLKTPQIALIKDRLVNSLYDLSPKQRFEVLFFSGPVWQLHQQPSSVTNQWEKITNWHNFRPVGDLPQGEWRAFAPSVRQSIDNYITNDLYTTSGTDWRHPFSVALSMNPAPEMIYFLTDGKVDNSELTLDIIDTHVSEGSAVPINTIAFGLDDQDGVATLEKMSTDSGGQHIAYSMAEIEELYEILATRRASSAITTQRLMTSTTPACTVLYAGVVS